MEDSEDDEIPAEDDDPVEPVDNESDDDPGGNEPDGTDESEKVDDKLNPPSRYTKLRYLSNDTSNLKHNNYLPISQIPEHVSKGPILVSLTLETRKINPPPVVIAVINPQAQQVN